MIVTTLNHTTLKYLTFVLQTHCDKGLGLDELDPAAASWKSLKEAQEILPNGKVRSAYDISDEAEEPVKASDEPETTHITGPVSVTVNGDMTMPLPVQP